MGSQPSYNKPQPNIKKKIIIQLRNRTIIVHHSYKMSLQIADVAVFPHGCQGLRLWDTDIIGARYIIMNHNRFVNQDVFVLNGRTGICGIALRKWTKCKSVVITDFKDEVVGNIKNNCDKNGVKTSSEFNSNQKIEVKSVNNQATVYRLNFKQLNQYSSKYDNIFIVDGFCKGCPVLQLYALFKRYLRIQGRATIIVPQREDDRAKFFAYIKEQNCLTSKPQKRDQKKNEQQLVQQEYPFSFEIRQVEKKLLHQQYFSSPLPNQVQGMSEFPLIDQLDYSVFQIIKKSQEQIPSPLKVAKRSQDDQKQTQGSKIMRKEEQQQNKNEVTQSKQYARQEQQNIKVEVEVEVDVEAEAENENESKDSECQNNINRLAVQNQEQSKQAEQQQQKIKEQLNQAQNAQMQQEQLKANEKQQPNGQVLHLEQNLEPKQENYQIHQNQRNEKQQPLQEQVKIQQKFASQQPTEYQPNVEGAHIENEQIDSNLNAEQDQQVNAIQTTQASEDRSFQESCNKNSEQAKVQPSNGNEIKQQNQETKIQETKKQNTQDDTIQNEEVDNEKQEQANLPDQQAKEQNKPKKKKNKKNKK